MENKFYCNEKNIQLFKDADKWTNVIYEPLKVEIVDNATVYPLEINPDTNNYDVDAYGGVVDSNGKVVELSRTKRKAFNKTYVKNGEFFTWTSGKNPKYNEDEIEYRDEEVVFLGQFHYAFIHFLMEGTSRFWYFLNEENFNKKVVFLRLGEKGKLPNYITEFMELFGFDKNKIEWVDHPIKFKRVIVPEQSFVLNGSCNIKFKEIFDKILKDIKPSKFKKVIFSKKNCETSDIYFNWSTPDKIFKRNGFKVFYPELLSMKERLSILKGCEVFVAQQASNALQAIFLKDNCEVIELCRSMHPQPMQEIIRKLRNHKMTRVDCFYDILPSCHCRGYFAFQYTPYLKAFLKDNSFKYNRYSLAKSTEKTFINMFDKYCKIWGVGNRIEILKNAYIPKNANEIQWNIETYNNAKIFSKFEQFPISIDYSKIAQSDPKDNSVFAFLYLKNNSIYLKLGKKFKTKLFKL